METFKEFKLRCKGCGVLLAQVRELRHEKMRSEIKHDFMQNTTLDAKAKGVAFAHCGCGTITPFLLSFAEALGPVPVVAPEAQD